MKRIQFNLNNNKNMKVCFTSIVKNIDLYTNFKEVTYLYNTLNVIYFNMVLTSGLITDLRNMDICQMGVLAELHY